MTLTPAQICLVFSIVYEYDPSISRPFSHRTFQPIYYGFTHGNLSTWSYHTVWSCITSDCTHTLHPVQVVVSMPPTHYLKSGVCTQINMSLILQFVPNPHTTPFHPPTAALPTCFNMSITVRDLIIRMHTHTTPSASCGVNAPHTLPEVWGVYQDYHCANTATICPSLFFLSLPIHPPTLQVKLNLATVITYLTKYAQSKDQTTQQL